MKMNVKCCTFYLDHLSSELPYCMQTSESVFCWMFAYRLFLMERGYNYTLDMLLCYACDKVSF